MSFSENLRRKHLNNVIQMFKSALSLTEAELLKPEEESVCVSARQGRQIRFTLDRMLEHLENGNPVKGRFYGEGMSKAISDSFPINDPLALEIFSALNELDRYIKSYPD